MNAYLSYIVAHPITCGVGLFHSKRKIQLEGSLAIHEKSQLYFFYKKTDFREVMHSKLELNKAAETFDRAFLMSNRDTSMCCFFPSNIDQNPNWAHHSILFEISIDQSVRL